MATLLLQAAGAAFGGMFGAVGGIIGQAAGALAGNLLDNALLAPRRTVQGARLSNAAPFGAEEGAPLPRLYGTARVSGTMIWATRFEEAVETSRRGAKAMGGTRVSSYRYFANVAFALCEGPIAGIRRVWADGRELDLTEVELRVHRGTEDAEPDPLILAKQGADNAPAYRGTAVAVLERFALEQFGNRVPQLQFEVMRPVGALERDLRAVTIIPGSTEFGYEPEALTVEVAPGDTRNLNRHVLHAGSDWAASLDELQALCPRLENVALVVSWFGDDLRAGHCTIRPGAVEETVAGEARAWRGGGLTRAQARTVSRLDGRAAYGGTPDDASVIRAIRDLKARGLKVTLYPFVMLDIPPGNTLPDPYGTGSQPAHPWRGRITCHPAEGRQGSPQDSAAVTAQVQAFLGAAATADFSHAGDLVTYAGAPADWGYRRFILHCAELAAAAGGVDAFLIGSELKGLTRLHAGGGSHPFVGGLMALATDVKAKLGPSVRLTYAADWTEYAGVKPLAAPNDLRHPLDPLWAHPAIDAIGIDWYAPLADWRDGDRDGAGPDGAAGPHDLAALTRGITSGEGWDWFYADDAARAARTRTPITDGSHGKPWVWRVKALRDWWQNPHHDRAGGVEAAAPTAWVPRSKPIWLTEIGCPAVDKGANQPNVFPDPKSSENALPHHSDGLRDDVQQRLYLEAHLGAFDPSAPGFSGTFNPDGGLYGGRMLDPARCYAWAWDARPFPAFPQDGASWGDGANWQRGHWLNGRLGGVALRDLLSAVFSDHGLPQPELGSIGGWLSGFAVQRPETVRDTLDGLLSLFGIVASATADGWRFQDGDTLAAPPEAIGDVVADDDRGSVRRTRAARSTVPDEVLLTVVDPFDAYETTTARARRAGASLRQASLSLPAVLDAGSARILAERWLDRARDEAEGLQLALPMEWAGLRPGDVVRLGGDGAAHRIERLTLGSHVAVEARRLARLRPVSAGALPMLPPAPPPPATGKAELVIADLPAGPADAETPRLVIAAQARPWRRQAVMLLRNGAFVDAARLTGRAAMGVVAQPVPPGRPWRFTPGVIRVRLHSGALASATERHVLDGQNTAIIRSAAGGYEVLQFRDAVETAPDLWELSGLLRGQWGTEEEAAAGAPAGAPFLLVDAAAATVATGGDDPVELAIGPAHKAVDDAAWRRITVPRPERSLLPPSPVGLKAQGLPGGGLSFSWIRRGRVDADSWEPAEIPLGEDAERYGYVLMDPLGTIRRRGTVHLPQLAYAAAERALDFGSAATALTFGVWQEGRLAGRGRMTTLDIPAG